MLSISLAWNKIGKPYSDFPKYIWRKVRDSNPRYHVMGIPDFESSAFGHSANFPFMHAKLIIKIVNGARNPNN